MNIKIRHSLRAIFTIVISIVCFSCNNDDGRDNDRKYYFKAKFNGKQYDLLHDAQFQGGGNENKWQHVVIAGYESDYDPSRPIEQTPHSFELDLWNEGGNFSPGIYTQNGGGSYDDAQPESYTIDGEYIIQTKDKGTVQYDARDTGDFTLKIIEISRENGIKGTFNGILSNENDFSDKLVVTQGEFYLPLDKTVNN